MWSAGTPSPVSLLHSEDEAETIKIRAEAIAFREHAMAFREHAIALTAAARESAEREENELRAMSAELSQMAIVVQRLVMPDKAPAREQGPQAAAPQDAAPQEGAPRVAAVAKPGRRARQRRAARIVVGGVVGLVLFSAASGATEIGLHGFPFFVFRSAATGATPANGLQEDQGPGQPDAPGAHHHRAALHHHDHTHHRPAKAHASATARLLLQQA